jgi:hypothetical protein
MSFMMIPRCGILAVLYEHRSPPDNQHLLAVTIQVK